MILFGSYMSGQAVYGLGSCHNPIYIIYISLLINGLRGKGTRIVCGRLYMYLYSIAFITTNHIGNVPVYR
jgi:hypothetical protein